VVSLVLQYIVPCSIITFCYASVSRVLRRRAKTKIGNSSGSARWDSISSSSARWDHDQHERLNKHQFDNYSSLTTFTGTLKTYSLDTVSVKRYPEAY